MSLIPIDHASARGIVSDVQPPSESLTFYQQPEQTSSDRLPRRHQPDHQSPFESHINMDSVDVHHQYKHPRHNHYLHHHHIQPQPIPHHHFHQLPVAETYFDTGDGLITSDVNSVSCDIVSRIEKEKQGLPHKIHADQCAGISVHMSFKPCEDGCVSVKTHEETSFPPKARSEVHTIPGRHENFNDGRYSHSQLYPFASSLFLVAPRIKLLCSIGGRIMGRPADGDLRYCGGDNRLISVEHGIRFSDLLAKLSRTYGPGLTLKYQLPGEDLDALVSVSSDDDLQNMLDEYDRMVAKGSNSWFRLFLFQKQSDLEASFWFDFGHGRGHCCSQVMQRYIDAINGFDAIGVTEKPTDVLMENNLNGCVSTSRVSSDTSHTTLNGPCLTTKAFSLVPSASPSVPSSPSGASRQVQHKQCCTGDTCLPLSKEQQNSMFSMNGLDTSTQEPARDCHVDVLKFEPYQSHLQGECLKMQHESPYNRCDASGVKENGTCIIDTVEPCVYHRDRHQGTGTAHMGMCQGNPKVGGITEPQCEARCGYHRVSQPVTSVACHGGQVDTSFCGCEPAAHSFVEQHKQCLHPHHLYQTGPPLPHWEGPFRSQKAPDSVPVCQIGDDQGLHYLVKAPVQVTVQNTSRTSPISLKTLGSAPSSPRNACLGRCGCCHQHFQVDRGINVSLGEHSYSQKPSYVEGHMNRRHGGPLFSSYSDGPNICSDSDVLHCVPTLAKHVELDEQEYDTCPRKQALHTRNNNFCHPIEHSTNENAASSLMEPMHCLHEGGPAQNQVCRANFHNAKGQQLVNSKVFSAPEGQIYMGQLDPYSRNHKEGIMSRGWPHDLKSDASVERVSDTLMGMTISSGPEIPSLQNVHGASGYAHVQGSTYPPIAGHKELHSDLTSQSFSSTDAIAGSLTSLPLEPAGWVGSPPAAIHNQQSKETECGPPVDHIVSFRHFVDGTVKHESLVDTSRTPSLDCIDCHTKVVSVNSSANAVEPNAEISPVISFTSGTEDKCSLLTEDKMGTSYVHGSQSKVDDSFHPLISSKTFAKKTLGPADFKGSATFPMPVYDQSPISSIANAPGFSQHAESKSVSLEKETNKPGANNSNASKAFPHQNHGGYEEMAKTDADSTHRISEHKTKTVLEESRPNSKPSSSHCSLCLEEKTLETVPVARSSETNQTAQEVNVSGSVDACSENDKELPATQAEAEAITRGLQIIKNDDLEDLKELGSGTYGTVFHGKWRGSDVAIKRIKPSCFMGSPSEQERLISDFWREAGTLSQLHHPNIVAFYGVVPDGPEGTLATVTEYMVNGSLKQVLMKKDRTIDRRKRLLIAMDAAFGMEYLHSKRIVHFDLKSENLLVNMRDAHRPICKVGDFGLSKVKHQTLVSGGVRGTLPWMAPELLDTKGRVTEKVDVYSFGIVMWELLTGEEPYAKMHCGTIIGGIVHNNLRPAVPSWCDPSWRDLMERCWSGNPSDRPDFSTVASELRAIASSMNVK